MPTQMMVGEVLDGRYELTEIIGEGGMGVVFKAKQLSVNRDVAIKVMKSEMFAVFGLVRRFKLEMEIISSLQHPNIVRLLDTGDDKRLGVVFLVMEFVEGVSLGHLLYEHASEIYLKPELAIEIAIQICSALTEPHRLGVIHRDLKPDNIILMVRSDEQLNIKLLDFGVARIVENSERIETSEMSRLTATGGIVGTPPYIAPELCESSRYVSIKSDLYAVGALLFELLTGFPPFQGRSTAEVFFKHVHEPAPLLLDASPVPGCACEQLEELIARLLAKDPDDRPESALHVKRQLDEIRQKNRLARPSLTYTTKVPTVASFQNYIGTVDELLEIAEGKIKAPDQASDHRATLTPPPPIRHSRRDSKSLLAADNTSSMEIPRATPIAPEYLYDESDSYTYEMPIPSQAKKGSKAGIWIGVIGLAIIAAGIVFSSTRPKPETDTPPLERPAKIEEPILPPSEETPSVPQTPSVEFGAAVQSSSALVFEAVEQATSSMPTDKIDKKKRTPSPSKKPAAVNSEGTSPSEEKPEKAPSKIKNNIDWLYKK